MHRVCILALDGVVPFDLAIPCEVFGRAETSDGDKLYRVSVCASMSMIKTDYFTIKAAYGLDEMNQAELIIVPGQADVSRATPPRVLAALRRAAKRGATIASICSGAFVLAEAGLLDGKRATTHWAATDLLASQFPLVTVDPNVLFVDQGNILTSAGAASGIDLCLYLVRLQCGAKVAAQAAKLCVMPLERSGGQAQFIVHEPPTSSGSLTKLLSWMEKACTERLSIAQIAKKAGMSPRSLMRKFSEQTGTTPLQWLLCHRIRRAQELLETTALTIDLVAEQAGFGCGVTFREQFRRQVGVPPRAYRNSFGAKVAL